MGKGTRKRQDRQEKLERQAQAAVLAQQKKRRTMWLVLAVAVVLILAVLAILWLSARAEQRRQDGTVMREKIAMSTEHFQVDGAMMSYFIHSELIDYAGKNADTLASVGLDPEKDLKEQPYVPADSTAETWFDYFSDLAKEKVTRYLRMAEGAYAAGYHKMDKKDEAHILSQLQTVSDEAKAAKQTEQEFISDNFGQGVNKDDIRRALELQMAVSKYETSIVEDKLYTDAELLEYYNAHPERLNTCDYYTITFTSSIEDDFTDEQVRSYNESSRRWAEDLAKCHDVDSFRQYLHDYYVQYYEEHNEDYDETEIQTAIDNTATLVERATYTDDEFGRWAMDPARKVGDTKVVEGNNAFSVYLITKAPTRMDDPTRSYRRILLTEATYETEVATRQKANDLRDQFEAGEQTEEAFAALAKKNSEDEGAGESGGLYANQRREDGDENVIAWLYDAARKSGDIRIIKGKDENYYLVYYVGEGNTCWKVTAAERMHGEDYDAAYGELSLKVKIKTDDAVWSVLPG